MIRVAIADDDALLRTGVALVLGSEDGIEVVGQAADGLLAVDLCRSVVPDVVLMDVRMPGIDGVEATRRIVAAGLATRVLVLTTFHHDDYVWGALRAGAAGFLLKRASPERLIDAVRTLAAGEALLDPAVTRDLVAQVVGRGRGPEHGAELARSSDGRGSGSGRGGGRGPGESLLARLTRREREVLRLAAEGLSNAEIAALLVVAESTVKTHMKRVLAKTEVRDRAQAVAFAYRNGLMTGAW
ncbi:response regulator transcription factor [Kitasatospora sp. NBC_01266]|uniref:response regulator transcription factor n=1 Tax=Kitasatospora sp. NBC_01266 TaxID=2903572 RepID=UPI002E35F83E|nr:response regulator transcription factor [Kitasatospora sp. NBC_01266]